VLGLISPLRFLAVSVPLFLVWEYFLRQPYLYGLAYLFAGTARLFGRRVHVMGVEGGEISFVYAGNAWVDQFGLTGINLVALVALVLATRDLVWRRRARMLGIAVACLVGTQVLGLWSDIVHVHLHTRPGALPFANGLRAFLTGFGTFLFPLLIWLVLIRDRLPLLAARLASAGSGDRGT
jgi:hypothetical protein